MASSADVSSGDLATAAQYNNLRADVLNTSSGHTHTGTDSKNLGTLTADLTISQSGASQIEVISTANDAYLILNSDTDEGQDSELIFESGGTARGRIEYNHHATANTQVMSFFTADNAVETLKLQGNLATFATAVGLGSNTLTTTGLVTGGGFTSTGDFTTTAQATDWDLIDNTASALSFDASGKTGILDIVTTNSSEGVTMSGTLGVTGTATLATVDIGAGAIDGTAIGASSASTLAATTGAFSGAVTVTQTAAPHYDFTGNWSVATHANPYIANVSGVGMTLGTYKLNVITNAASSTGVDFSIDEGGDVNIANGSLEVATIDFTDGDLAITINDTGTTTFAQVASFPSLNTNSIEVRWDGNSPFIDFSNDTGTDYDARIQLTGDDALGFYGADYTFNGNVTTTGNLNIQADGYIAFGDTNHLIDVNTGYMLFKMPTNEDFYWQQGSTNAMFLDTSASTLLVGTHDTAQGTLTIAGGASGGVGDQFEGGELRLHTAADHDGSYDYYFFDAWQDDLRIGRAGIVDAYLRSTGIWEFSGHLEIVSTTMHTSSSHTSRDMVYEDVKACTNVTAYATQFTITPSAVSDVWTQGLIYFEIGGHTSGVANGSRRGYRYFDIADGAPTVGDAGSDTYSSNAPAFRVTTSTNDILIQVQSQDGSSRFDGSLYVRILCPQGAGSAGASFTYTVT